MHGIDITGHTVLLRTLNDLVQKGPFVNSHHNWSLPIRKGKNKECGLLLLLALFLTAVREEPSRVKDTWHCLENSCLFVLHV
jgi:hypothetical protein